MSIPLLAENDRVVDARLPLARVEDFPGFVGKALCDV